MGQIKDEHKQMVTNKAREPFDKKDLLEGVKDITSTWACKKKSNGTCHGQVNAKGFEHVAGKHLDPMSTAAPVTNNTTVIIVLLLMLLVDQMARIYDVKHAFLKGKFEDGGESFMEVPQGMDHNYWDLVVLKLLKPLCGFKQATILLR